MVRKHTSEIPKLDLTVEIHKCALFPFSDSILDADWIEEYLEMGGVVSGFRKQGYAYISAGLKFF